MYVRTCMHIICMCMYVPNNFACKIDASLPKESWGVNNKDILWVQA